MVSNPSRDRKGAGIRNGAPTASERWFRIRAATAKERWFRLLARAGGNALPGAVCRTHPNSPQGVTRASAFSRRGLLLARIRKTLLP